MVHPWVRQGFLSSYDEHLLEALDELRTFNARAKLKGCVWGMVAASRVLGLAQATVCIVLYCPSTRSTSDPHSNQKVTVCRLTEAKANAAFALLLT